MNAPETETPDRFRVRVAVFIALASIAAAVATARASALSVSATDDDQYSVQQLVRQQQLRTALEGRIAQDRRLFPEYQEHVMAWRLLQRDAKKVRSEHPDLAEALEAEARGERSIAVGLQPFFTIPPDLGDAKGRVVYDVGYARRTLTALDIELKDLTPEATFREGQRIHVQIVRLIGVAALLIASLFFLTLAQLTRVNVRGIFAWAGGAVMVLGVAAWILVEVVG